MADEKFKLLNRTLTVTLPIECNDDKLNQIYAEELDQIMSLFISTGMDLFKGWMRKCRPETSPELFELNYKADR